MNDATTEKKEPSRRRLWIACVALVAAVAVGYGVVSTSRGADGVDAKLAAKRPVAVRVAPARTGEVRVYLDGIGTVTPLASVTVRSRVDGELTAVHFREGDEVRAGDVLAEIDPRPFQVQLEQAEGQKERDEALLANARVDLKRYRTLVAQDSIPKQQLDTQDSLVHQYEAALATDDAQIDQAKLQLDYARIEAPASGRLGLRLVDAGNIVHASDAGGLVVLTQMKPISVVFPIPEDDLPQLLPKLRAGVLLPVEAWDREGRQRLALGRVLTIDNAIDPATGTVRVKAEFPNEDETLFPSQFVNVRLLLDVRRDATLVPSGAVQHGTNGPFVYVVKPGDVVELRPVTPGPVEGEETSLESGLATGEIVVVDGAQGLRTGSSVTRVEADAGDRSAEARDSS